MPLNKQMLQNMLVFLERVQLTGREAIAWAEAYTALKKMIDEYDSTAAPH